MKILLIAGHGEGDPGAVGNGFNESDKTRELLNLVNPLLKQYAEVSVYDTSKNCYEQSKAGNPPNWKAFDYVVEFHFNAFNTQAHGTEIYIDESEKGYTVETAIVNNIAALGFTNRKVQRRNNLLNMNLCTNAGVSYCLIETCFIDNAADMKLYEASKDNVANAIVKGIVTGFGLSNDYKETETEPGTSVYKVQCGAYKEKANADNMKKKLDAIGQENFIVNEQGFYKVQCGAFAVKENAYKLAEDLRAKGFDVFVKRY